MDSNIEKLKRSELVSLLKELSDDQALSSAKKTSMRYRRLESVYYSENETEKFRHFYSDIFEVLADDEFDRDTIGQNVAHLRNHYKPQNTNIKGETIDISNNLRKLDDHVSLEIARLAYADKDMMELELDSLRSQIYSLDDGIEKTKKDQKKVAAKVGKQEREYIAILGIFAAIIITFVGAISFTSSILESIGTAKPENLAVVGLVIGVVLVNSLYGLFHYIERIVNPTKPLNTAALLISDFTIAAILIALLVKM